MSEVIGGGRRRTRLVPLGCGSVSAEFLQTDCTCSRTVWESGTSWLGDTGRGKARRLRLAAERLLLRCAFPPCHKISNPLIRSLMWQGFGIASQQGGWGEGLGCMRQAARLPVLSRTINACFARADHACFCLSPLPFRLGVKGLRFAD